MIYILYFRYTFIHNILYTYVHILYTPYIVHHSVRIFINWFIHRLDLGCFQCHGVVSHVTRCLTKMCLYNYWLSTEHWVTVFTERLGADSLGSTGRVGSQMYKRHPVKCVELSNVTNVHGMCVNLSAMSFFLHMWKNERLFPEKISPSCHPQRLQPEPRWNPRVCSSATKCGGSCEESEWIKMNHESMNLMWNDVKWASTTSTTSTTLKKVQWFQTSARPKHTSASMAHFEFWTVLHTSRSS